MTIARWVGVGESVDTDSAAAGASARASALAGRDAARLLIVFASPAHDLPALLRGIAPGDVPLVGCSTAGEIATSGPGDHGVVVLALGGPGFAACTRVATGASKRLREAGAEVAECLQTVEPRPHRALLLLSDGLAGDQQAIVRGAYDVAGSGVPLVGGCAGDDLAMRATFQLYGEQVLQDAVIGVALGSDAPLGIGVQHGWQRVGEPVLVTSSAGNRVFTLDDRPALDVYLERLEAPAEVWDDPAAFTLFALSHPLGLGRRSGEDHVRFVGGANFEDRSLGCIAEVPQGGIAFFMEGDSESVLTATDGACAGALAALDGAPALGVLAFDCIARRSVLGAAGIADEVSRIGAACGGAPVAGFYTYGEIARTRGISGFHNQTLVVMALA
ncbi:FIST C-terminal domain-containing protein [Solirubrobacter phytolaccae]|uniref:FIST C-terminal domain-containing protein n=1 Tax=Solirubrobacter phytolaccae TaxID=1404360 RepID=A0A9X3SBN4_9ACTN|nr:FIST N-terminal domain-containing protein [Solirubrobacter phytolaccae]MDA0185749.1 FIST C-terminal domain-containing protein [Solirubrobacter phytolaccae]